MHHNDVFLIEINKKKSADKIFYKILYVINSYNFSDTITVKKNELVGNIITVPESFWENIELNGVIGSKLNNIIHRMEKGEEFGLPIYLGNLQDVHNATDGHKE
ncbi:MAG: hypothetical protein KC433_12320 [Anaerolineales bacterium]|nr:hypothetical protein [Anaerolineaceae bacterium]MCA9898967.1 hypothetical protein [Anaerolineales bacterium]MCB8937972.1 hypothetical protein [Ardenticatenaceae bacterium]